MINEKSAANGIGTKGQLCLYVIEKGHTAVGDFGSFNKTVWCIQNTSVPVYSAGKSWSRPDAYSGAIRSLYGKTGTQPDKTGESSSIFDEFINQQTSKNGIGRVFIKTRPWRKRKGKLTYPVFLTGTVSKSSQWFIVFLYRIMKVM
jgi:hypothetical protein